MGTKEGRQEIFHGIVGLDSLGDNLSDYLGRIAAPNRAFLIDTSVLLEAASPYGHARKGLARRILELVKEGRDNGVDAFVTPGILEECFFKLIRLCYLNYAKSEKVDNMAFVNMAARGLAWDKLYKQFPDVISERCCDKIDRFYDIITNRYGLFTLEPGLPRPGAEEESMTPVTDRMRTFICEYNLLPQDSLNLAIADTYDVRNVITFDSDFSRAANRFRIYMPDSV